MTGQTLMAKIAENRQRGFGTPMLRAPLPGARERIGSEFMTVPGIDASVASLHADKAASRKDALPMSFGRKGSLEVRIAQSAAEIDAAQALRYHVFYEEMSATPDEQTRATRRDVDRFDALRATRAALSGLRRSSVATACCARKWRIGMAASIPPVNSTFSRC